MHHRDVGLSRRRVHGKVNVLAVVMALIALAPFAVNGQGQSGTAERTTRPRTADGHPDLQGIWSFATLTPLERPSELAGKQMLTDQEAAEFEKRAVERNNADRRDGAGTDADVARAYNDFWYDRGTKIVGTRRTSLIVDPPDGRIPSLTPEAQQRLAALAAVRSRPAASWEDRSPGERCVHHPKAGPPITPGAYNNNIQVFQTNSLVAIVNEQIHDTRFIPLDGRPHLGSQIRQWMGDSRGHWEGDTLVVETTNLNGRMNYQGSAENLRLVERFTRMDDDVLLYEYTVEDPTSFAKPWTVQLPMTKTSEPIFEYACHEGNYGMVGILAGARAEEKAAEAARKKESK
jgi:hypothetical protein